MPETGRWITRDPAGFVDGPNLYAYVHGNPLRYYDPYGLWSLSDFFGGDSSKDDRDVKVESSPTLGCAIALPAAGALAQVVVDAVAICVGSYCMAKQSESVSYNKDVSNTVGTAGADVEVSEPDSVSDTPSESSSEKKEENVFPENPDDLLPDLPRDDKGRIQAGDNIRIVPEKHPWKTGDAYNPRHHGQHDHVETRRKPKNSWKHKNVEKLKPSGYQPGDGTGFLPGELFPGAL